MSKSKIDVEMDASEVLKSKDMEDQAAEPTNAINTKYSEYERLISKETLRESPIEWPERFPGMEEFLIASKTPIHVPNVGATQIPTDRAAIHQFARLAPDQLLEKINSMHDQIYKLGLLESKEMTRGKLLGIFDRERLTNATIVRN